MNIIITGASRGIGRELVKNMADTAEHSIIAISRNEERLHELKDECNTTGLPGKVIPLPFDLETGDFEIDLVPKIIKELKTIDILINNAGLLINKSFTLLDSDDFDRLFSINVKSVFTLSQSLVGHFKPNAHIVNIGSMGGFSGSVKFPGLSLYSASKGALGTLTECMAEELKDHQIKVNCLCIGSAQTEMLDEAFPGYKAPVSANEMAEFIANFALTANYYMNGKIIPVSLTTP